MPVAQGSCPACGAPIEFGLGSSLAKVCEFCKATVLRTDRGFQNLGKVAELADTPALIAVGDQGTLGGRPIEVLGRVQLDQGMGPWDEYYVAFDHGTAWGWLAYAQGRWHVTSLSAPVALPHHSQLAVEQDVVLGALGPFRIGEVAAGTIRSAEGELPGAFPTGFVRYYADCYGQNGQFATIDYDDGTKLPTIFAGYIFAETQLSVTRAGPRTINKVKTTHLKCPSCGGEVPKLGGDRSERMGCPYCGTVSDIAERTIISQQERLLQAPTIPIGSSGQFQGAEYVCLAYVRRSSQFDDERYTWEEFLLFAPSIGYRWLVDDPETGWFWAMAISPADVDLRGRPDAIGYLGRAFEQRNDNHARVDYVLGEVYWKCSVGETVQVTDYASGKDIVTREYMPGEVNYTYSAPIAWPIIAQAFGLPVARANHDGSGGGASVGSGRGVIWKAVLLLALLLVCCIIGGLVDDCNGSGASTGGVFFRSGSSSGYRGGGVYSGGK